MKFKKIFTMILSISMMLSFSTIASAAELQPEYAITDEVVIIDSIPYEINNNTIQYNGLTYTVEEDYTLSRYDEGDKVIFVLPVEQNRVTDPEEIARLNAAVAELKNKTSPYSIPSDSISLPYSADVPEGQWNTITPAFDIIVSQFAYITNLKLTNFPLFADRRFDIRFSVCDITGEWTTIRTLSQDFLFNNTCRYENASSTRYGIFAITNLYGDPSPSYTYNIYLSNS